MSESIGIVHLEYNIDLVTNAIIPVKGNHNGSLFIKTKIIMEMCLKSLMRAVGKDISQRNVFNHD